VGTSPGRAGRPPNRLTCSGCVRQALADTIRRDEAVNTSKEARYGQLSDKWRSAQARSEASSTEQARVVRCRGQRRAPARAGHVEHGAALVRGGVLLRDGLGAAAPGAMVRQPHDGQRTAVRSGLGGDPARAQRASVVAGGEAARGIELKRAVDVDEDAAVSMVGGYRQALKSV